MINNLSIEKRGLSTPLFLTIEEIHTNDLSKTSVLYTKLTVGVYTFAFILDDTPDTLFDITWGDYVNVICLGEGTAVEVPPDLGSVFQGNAKPLIEK